MWDIKLRERADDEDITTLAYYLNHVGYKERNVQVENVGVVVGII